MAPHANRGRLTVSLGGNWRLYTNTAPAGCTMLGTVTRGGKETGALAQTEAGIYSMLNAGIYKSLDRHKIIAAIAEARAGSHGGAREGAGRPATGTRRVNVTLDTPTLARAKEIGDGNVSEGLRRAVRDWAHSDLSKSTIKGAQDGN